MNAPPPRLTRATLEALHRRHHRPENLFPDPLCWVRGFSDPAEGEAAGLVAAALAYGRAELIVRALEELHRRLGASPLKAVRSLPAAELIDRLDGFAYRFHKGPDLAALLLLLRRTLEKHGSLAALWRHSFRGDVGDALSTFAALILDGDPRPALPYEKIPQGHPVRHLLASPASGSAAKRLCLYLRWMIRRDELDPGHWEGLLPPSRLVIPLDTHVARVSRLYGLTRRRASDWKTACDITGSLRRFCPDDPLRYDFSLFRHGMSGDAPRKSA